MATTLIRSLELPRTGRANAAQPFGRDSVYVTPGTQVSKAGPGPAIARHGRDSVYVTQSPAGKPAPAVQTAVAYKAGRA